MAYNGKTALIIQGPTAVGKTAVSIQAALQLHTSIISADSRQCYKEMSIGTAKPSAEELQQVRHYFIDEYPVTTHLTAADYERIALQYLADIFSTKDTAIVCGGTGLYINALCNGLDDMPPADAAIEAEVNLAYKEQGIDWLQAAVQQEDPEFYAAGEIQNPSRMLRALIFKRSTGKSITGFRTGNKKERPFRIIKVGLELPREMLYERINQRVDIMMQEGLLEEVKALYPYKHLKNLQTVGYSELFEYIDGKCTLHEATEKIKQHTRNYAKRQMTWFKKDSEVQWLRADDKEVVSRVLAEYNNLTQNK